MAGGFTSRDADIIVKEAKSSARAEDFASLEKAFAAMETDFIAREVNFTAKAVDVTSKE
jgi:hypothetical protein